MRQDLSSNVKFNILFTSRGSPLHSSRNLQEYVITLLFKLFLHDIMYNVIGTIRPASVTPS